MLLLGVSYLFANTVTEATAKKVGLNFFANKVSSASLVAVKDMKLAYKQTNASAVTSFYVFNAKGAKGFVIVAADDNCSPILGYSDESNFDPANIPVQLKEMLQGYTNQINYVIANNKAASLNIKNTWQQLIVPPVNPLAKAPGAHVMRTPLIQTLWDQSPYYNNSCPYDNVNSARTLTGCVATAIAQVMRYWTYPVKGIGSHLYTPATNAYLGQQVAFFDAVNYDWTNMPVSLSASSTASQVSAVAVLMKQLGVSVNMDYGVSASSSSAVGFGQTGEFALRAYFGYGSTLGVHRSNYTDADWISLLEKEIDSARPVIYQGDKAPNVDGHAFIADAYDANNLFHINWGWGGSFNGFFAVNSLNPSTNNFNADNAAVIRIKPNSLTTPTVSNFTPATADSGTAVTITGTDFTGVTDVSFGGISASSFIVNSTTSITAVVGNGSNGSVSVTTSGGTASIAGFTYQIQPTSISSFAPATGGTGTIITITGSRFNNVTGVTIGGVAATYYTVNSSTSITAIVGTGAASGSVSVATAKNSSASKSGFIYSVSTSGLHTFSQSPVADPNPLIQGQYATLITCGFINLNPSTFSGSIRMVLYNANNQQIIYKDLVDPSGSLGQYINHSNVGVGNLLITVPPGNYNLAVEDSANGSGAWKITNTGNVNIFGTDYGTTYNPVTITVQSSSALTVTGFAPATGGTGTTVTISGSNFINVTGVTIGGVPTAYTVINSTSIAAVVGNGFSGSICVTTNTDSIGSNFNTVCSAGSFTYTTSSNTSPVISGFAPIDAGTGTTVTITGTGFTGATVVNFGGIAAASFNIVDDNTITAVVGSGATGTVDVSSPYGGSSLSGFTYIATNTAPAFVNSSPQAFAICQNASATSINSLLTITDPDASQTETYSVTGNPSHGSITAGTTVGSGTGVSPTGWSYTPANGYSGTDAFTIQVSDGNGGTASTTVHVTVKASSTSTIDTTVCEGLLPYTWRGYSFNAAGTHLYHTTNAAGCDSSVTLNMAVKANGVSYNDTTLTTCSFPFVWRGATITGAGSQTVGFANYYGCDSTAYFTITVIPAKARFDTTICAGALPLTWRGVYFSVAGQIISYNYNSLGCQLIDTLNLNVKASGVSHNDTTLTACSFPFTWRGQTINAAGSPSFTFVNMSGCDSTAYFNITVKTTETRKDTIVCEGLMPYTWKGYTYNAAGTNIVYNTNSQGCQFIDTFNLRVKANGVSQNDTAVCAGAFPFNWRGHTFTVAGLQDYGFINMYGCDSTAHFNITVKAGSSSTTNLTINSSQIPYSWNGLTFNAAGTQTANLINSVGCDSAATLNLTVNSGITGNSLSFDGVNDNVSIGNPAALQFGSTSSFTIEVWLKPNTANASNWNAVIDKSFYNSQKGFLIYNGGGALNVVNVSGGATVGSTSLPYNAWTHIAVSYNNGTWKLYKNGILKSTATNKFYIDAISPVTIGMRTANTGSGLTDAYAGLMDEVRFWNVEKTAAAIQSDMNCDVAQQAGLVAYYRFDQGTASGTNTGINYANDYSGNGNCGTLNNFALSGATSNWVTGTISSCNSINVNCAPNYIWTGATSSNWIVASNWSNNVLPTSGATVTIPSAPTNQPVLSTDINVGGIILNGTVSINGYTCTISGAVSGTGTFKGSAASSLVVNSSSSNTINFGTTATDSLLANLTVSGSGTVSLGSGLGITTLLTVSSGALNTGNHLTLKSTSILNTAVVAAVGGTISGIVTVERFIPKGLRSYRDLGAEVANAGSILNNWQESGNKPVGYGMYITGVKGVAPGGVDANLGLDKTQSGNPSLYIYGAGTWPSVTNTKTTNLDPFMGYRALVRGDRTYNIYALDPATMPSATTLRTTGNLVTGDVVYNTTNVTNTVYTSTAAKLNNGINNFSFVANPYASPIDWESVFTNTGTQNITSSYWYLDPTFFNGGYATYITYNASSHVISNFGSKLTRHIQPGMAFFVQNSNSSAPSLSIKESNKVTGSTKTAVFGTDAKPNLLSVILYKNLNGDKVNVDGTVAVFNSNYTRVIGDKDSKKLTNGGENLFITQSNMDLSIAGLPEPTVNDEIELNLSQVVVGNSYQLQLDVSQYTTTGLDVFIKDKFLNTVVSATAGINFTPTTNVVTYAGRFSIVFRTAVVTPLYVKGSVSVYPNPVSKNKFNLQMCNLGKGTYVVSVINSLGQEVWNSTINHEEGASSEAITIKQLASGVYTLNILGKNNSYNTEMIVQ